VSEHLRLDGGDLAALHELAETWATRSQAASIAYGVVGRGRLLAVDGLGDPGDGRGRPDERTRYRIASMSKSFTAAAVLHARDAGRLALDDPLTRWVPAAAGLTPPTADSPALTVRHLLTMSGGLATDDAWADRHLDVAQDELLGWLSAGATFAGAPGTTFEYSNLGYGILGQVIEAATGQRLQDYVTQHLLQPLGMADTVWSDDVAADGVRHTTPHRVVDGAVVVDQPPALADGGFGPMGGLWSTVGDLARWVVFFTDAFPPRDDVDDSPLSRASRREMQQSWRSFPTALVRADVLARPRLSAGGYGMGLQVLEHVELGAVVTHSGGLPGYGSNMRWLPERGVGIVTLADVRYAPMALFSLEALELLSDRGALGPLAARPAPLLEQAGRDLAELLSRWDDERAAALFADNVALDDPLTRRRAAAERLTARHGPLQVASVRADRPTRGQVELEGQQGRVRVDVELSPHVPPLIQKYDCTSVMPASDELLQAAERLAGLASSPHRGALASLLAPDADVDLTARRLDAAHLLCGKLTVGDVVACDGATEDGVEKATQRWHGERGDLHVTLTRAPAGVTLDAMVPRPLPDR